MPSTEPRDPRPEGFSGNSGAESVLADLVRAARKRRLLVAGVVALMVATSLVFSVLREPVYRAEAVVSVQPKGELGGVRGTEDLPDEVLNIVAREELLGKAAEKSGWSAGLSEFKERLDVEEITGRDTQSGLRVSFSWTDSEEAARAANAYAAVFVERARSFSEERFAGGTLAAETSLQSKAQPPMGGYWVRVSSGVGVAVIAGLLAGVAAALVLEARSRGWSSVRDVEIALKVPVIGVVSEYPLSEGTEGEDRP